MMNTDENGEYIMSDAEQEMELVQRQFRTNKLYGRASHLKQLLDTCLQTSAMRLPQVALVVGSSGSGKSSLVLAAMDPLKERGFQFISGKFDQLQHAEPLHAIIIAFNQYFDDISRSSAEQIDLTKTVILDATGDCSGVLTEFFPRLDQILGDQSATPDPVGAKEAQHRFEYIFRLMIRAIATPSNPIVFFLDDLQWADTYSLHLITTLVTDKEIENVIFLGCFRDDEVDNTHPLVAKLHEMETKSVEITKITLTNLNRDDIMALISDTFRMPENLAMTLTDILYQKTDGNVFCITQFLRSLYDSAFLRWSEVSNNWEMNIRGIEEKHIPDNAVRIMICKICGLPEKSQYALKLMSCIGSSCFESTLKLFLYNEVLDRQKMNMDIVAGESLERESLFSYLGVAVHEGLVIGEGPNYKFAHDQIQYAAYSLIPDDEKCAWHLQIGCAIWKNVSDKDKDKVVFLAADQMNRGMTSIESEHQRNFLAMLNLRAGERAMSLSTFSSSATYFRTGIKLLRQDCWRMNYDLSLHLHNYYAEAEYCNGNFCAVGQVTGIILTEAKSYYDKLRAYHILIKALGSQDKLFEAIDVGVDVLEKLGKQLPSQFSDKSSIFTNFNKIKETLESMTQDEFLNLKMMEDSDTLIAMNFLSELLLFTYLTKQDYCVNFINLMMLLTLDYGVCNQSCFALAFCSRILCGTGDYKASERIGYFALSLLERLDTKTILPRVYSAVYSGILCRLEPPKTVAGKFLYAYEVGMQIGDIQFAMTTAYQYCGYSFCSGGKLEELKRNIQVFEKQMIEYKQETLLSVALPTKHAVLALVDWIDEPSQQMDEFMADAKKPLAEHIEKKRLFPASVDCFYCGCMAYIFCKYDVARDLMEMRKKINESLCNKFDAYGAAFFLDGLVSVALARKEKQDKWINFALECLDKTKKSVLKSQHRGLLLETEIDILLKGEKIDAISSYDKAIDAARQSEYIHEQAIANERAGDFCLSQGDVRSSHYYGEAYRLYLQWGANGKAAQLKRNSCIDISLKMA